MQPVELFADLPLNESCIDVEATAGHFVVFRNNCARSANRGSPTVDRALLDAAAKKVVARLQGLSGPVGVTPNGRLLTALPEGVCAHFN